MVDLLSPEKLGAVRTLLEVMAEPLALAPIEEEELNEEAAGALDRAEASLDRGEGRPHDEVLREFGLIP